MEPVRVSARTWSSLAAVVLLVVMVALPSRVGLEDAPQDRPPLTPIADYLLTIEPPPTHPYLQHAALTTLTARSLAQPAAAVRDLDAMLRRWLDSDWESVALPADVATLIVGTATESVTPVVGAGTPLPLRAVASLGARGVDLLRVSAENSAAFPPALSEALLDLLTTIEHSSRAFADQRRRLVELIGEPALAACLERWNSPPDHAAAMQADEAALIAGFDRSLALAAQIDLAAAVRRAVPRLLLAMADPALAQLRHLPAGEGIPANLVFVSESDAGLVILGGAGTSVMPMAGVALAIDLAGDDHWHDGLAFGDAALPVAPVSVTIDLAGRDQYTAIAAGLCAARLGAAVSIDLAGADRYEAIVPAFGSAMLGAALLIDLDGDDRYVVPAGGIGFGWLGSGLLYDGGGDDRYQATRMAVGCGSTGGLGAVIDRDGTDFYVVSGDDARDGHAIGIGAGVSAFQDAPGGVGLVLDGAGDDVYRMSGWGGGFAYGVSFGALFDLTGDDTYSTGEASLASGHAGGVAVCFDGLGADRVLSRGYSQGFADGGIALFVDQDGIDDNVCLKPARGVASASGVAVYVDR